MKSARELATIAAAPNVVALHPAVLQRFERQVERLQTNLARTVEADDPAAAEAIRDLVESVTVKRDAAKPAGLGVVIAGRLDRMMRDAASRPQWCGEWW